MVYDKNTANYPRLSTDCFFDDYNNEYQFNGFIDKAICYIEEFQLLAPLKNGEKMTVTDYASAGKLWSEESKMAAWILTDKQ